MSDLQRYTLGEHITAFTTDRTIGRDRELLLEALDMPADTDFLYPHQTHTDNVICVDEQLLAMTINGRQEVLEGVDAIISNVPNVVMGISTADCIPVIVYDPTHRVAAAIHAGWKGTRQRIVEKAIAIMTERYGTSCQDCKCVIGPGISQDSFEVGQEVVDAFTEAGFEMNQYVIMKAKPHIDLKAINMQQLIKMGVKKDNIIVSDIDTMTDGRFFSARREQKGNVKCGRILSGFVLNH